MAAGLVADLRQTHAVAKTGLPDCRGMPESDVGPQANGNHVIGLPASLSWLVFWLGWSWTVSESW